MRVLLISPPLHSLYHAARVIIPPLGLLYVAGALERAGHEVEVRDMTFYDGPRTYDDADIIGLTCTTPQYNAALRYAREAHEAGKLVMMGGSHVTFTTHTTLRLPYVDFIVRGEGEITAVDLVDSLEREGRNFQPSTIPSLSWYDKNTGQVVDNQRRPDVRTVDDLPMPARHLLDVTPYKVTRLRDRPAITMITSRGCPFNCTFCSVPTMYQQRKWRGREAVAAVDEMEYLEREYGFGGVLLVDDLITVNVQRIHDLCDEILERGLKVYWWCQSRADILMKNLDMVEKMARAGCSNVFLGLESGNPEVLKHYNKRLATDTGREAVDLLRQHGIRALTSFILGDVDETPEQIRTTIDYAVELDAHQAQFSLLTPYPGTQTWEQVKDRIFEDDWDRFDGTHIVFHRTHMDAHEIKEAIRSAYRRFYVRSERIGRMLKGLNGLSVSSLWSMMRVLSRSNDHEKEILDPVSSLIPLSPISRDEWLSTAIFDDACEEDVEEVVA
ncbi:MAG: cobalamin B12-binding domain-containing protein [Candidatus Latescibacteria bacterium]|nr:cobalamin B12-binding domain-containing protein [Candidatus Latescibacterota bacterium]